jgi:dTDP-4-amino-4,6-dideoxygalactose transaminase
VSWAVALADVKVPEEDVQAVLDCIENGWLTMGPRIERFEAAFADYVGAPHAAAVSSGTAALHLALLAAGVGEGDEVIVPGLPFVATAAAVRYVGAEPVLCDVLGVDDFSIDPDRAAALIGPRTKGIAAVHVMGYPAAAAELKALCDEHGLFLLEDAAQAVGATLDDEGTQAGTYGLAGAYSFFSKGQLAVGEGGMVVTADDAVDARVRSLRSHAMTSVTWDRHLGHWNTYDIVDVGFNFRLDEPRAALGLSRLARLDADIEGRRSVVRTYRERLRDLPGLSLPWSDEAVERSSHFAFPVVLKDRTTRDRFRDLLAERGIQTTWYPSIGRLSAYATAAGADDLTHSGEVADRHCCLPLSSSFCDEQVDLVVNAVHEALPAADAEAESPAHTT